MEGAAVPTSFEDAAAKGVLSLPYCVDCDRAHWYPRSFCPHCRGRTIQWRPSSGRGSVYSFSVFRRAAQPYAIAYVALEEGPVMLTNLVECKFEDIAIGRQVGVRFSTLGGDIPMPAFTLV